MSFIHSIIYAYSLRIHSLILILIFLYHRYHLFFHFFIYLILNIYFDEYIFIYLSIYLSIYPLIIINIKVRALAESYDCRWCQRSFSKPYNLYIHERSHATGIYLYTSLNHTISVREAMPQVCIYILL